MNEIIEAVNRAAENAEAKAAVAADAGALEALRIEYLGRNGLFPELSKKMGTVPPEERKATGTAFNTGRTRIQAALDAAAARLGGAGKQDKDAIDLTLPGRRTAPGHRHPITQLADECVSVFRRMGFVAVDGPDIEDIYHNFDALNTPD
ncbi:MAG: phenylalanine--tRNA ligase subunit alpha, partial [Lentisphaeria bacterium]|nr:phenylalanine--tRNA ligase subunit alpha [Lentisphaeria bacterium]